MRTVDGAKLGAWSLRLDAAYCTLLGAGVAIAAPGIAPALQVPAVLLMFAGIAATALVLLAVLAVAVNIAIFAASQAFALRRLPA